ncbi:uncharacterized protein KRP23_14917 [Phytophthora ramorum]|uniref:uncharacterized protein n=1 Tax=Phytophthora ramorum TaxID=164328 RepID=UPI0030A13590|nr:hypothetical protein KRP23_14917 [Phytophthora ramorum]
MWEGVPSLGKMKRSLMARFVLKVFIQDELEAMKDKRSDVEKSVLKDEEAMCVVFGGSEKCHVQRIMINIVLWRKATVLLADTRECV